MIGEILISDKASFGPICAYVAQESKEGEVLAAHGVRDTSWADMAADFDAQKADNPQLTRAVMHVALAWSPEDQAISNALMVELARAWMTEMKIDPENTQWSLTRHNDRNHQHGHLIINRVADDGRTIPDKKNFDQSVAACRKLEQQYGLVNAKEAGQDTLRAKVRATPEAVPERDRAVLHIKDSESRHRPLVARPEELFAAMKRDGIHADAKYQKGKLVAVTYEYQGHFVKGSELGRECSGNNVAKSIEAQREGVLARREGLSTGVAPLGQLVAALEGLGQQVGAYKREADEKAAREAVQAQKEANEKAAREAAQERQRQATEKAKSAAQESPEKGAKQSQESRPGPAPIIERDDDERGM